MYTNVPVVNMREEPAISSKVVSQTIYSENITVIREKDGWSHIKTSDGYFGWVPSISYISTNTSSVYSVKTSRLASHIYGVKDIEYGPILTLPMGAELKLLEEIDTRWLKIALLDGREAYIQRGDVSKLSPLSHPQELVAFSKLFLNLPYTWGGRSSFGYDCSGFVQMLYKHMGIELERDARQQILDPRLQSIIIKELDPSNLIFFGKSEQKIQHVGVYLGENLFIHATARENKPWIRISSLKDEEWSGSPHVHYPYIQAKNLKSR